MLGCELDQVILRSPNLRKVHISNAVDWTCDSLKKTLEALSKCESLHTLEIEDSK